MLTSQFLALWAHIPILLLLNDPSEISLTRRAAQPWDRLLTDTGEIPSLQVFKIGVDKATAELI